MRLSAIKPVQYIAPKASPVKFGIALGVPGQFSSMDLAPKAVAEFKDQFADFLRTNSQAAALRFNVDNGPVYMDPVVMITVPLANFQAAVAMLQSQSWLESKDVTLTSAHQPSVLEADDMCHAAFYFTSSLDNPTGDNKKYKVLVELTDDRPHVWAA